MTDPESPADRAGRAYLRHVDPLQRPPSLRLVGGTVQGTLPPAETIQQEDHPAMADRHATAARLAAHHAALRRRLWAHRAFVALALAVILTIAAWGMLGWVHLLGPGQ